MNENCSINDTKSDYTSTLYSVSLMLFGNVEFTVPAVTKVPVFEFVVWQMVFMKANTRKITGGLFLYPLSRYILYI